MKIVVDGRRVTKGDDADYFKNTAVFKKGRFNRENVLHELYHHIVEKKGLEMTEKKEEREANRFVREVMKSQKV